ncbi:MAG: PA2779 family protein [Myxococcota bacterium]
MTHFCQRLVLVLCVVMLNTSVFPALSHAGPTPSSMGTVHAGTRQADIASIEQSLDDAAVQEALRRAGTDAQQIRLLLPRMSDHDVHQLAMNMDHVKTGGIGVVELLVVVLLVLLIVYLVQRV